MTSYYSIRSMFYYTLLRINALTHHSSTAKRDEHVLRAIANMLYEVT